MFRKLFCVLLVIGIAFGTALAAFLLQTPPQKSESLVVFSNMQFDPAPNQVISINQHFAIIFDVPVGSDYLINSVQVIINRDPIDLEDPRLSAHIHADNAGLPGPVIVDLGSQIIPRVFPHEITTFVPTGSNFLSNGQRYWLVISQPVPSWLLFHWEGRRSAPIGAFDFVDNGNITHGIPYSSTWPMSLSIDADPVVVPASYCTNTDGRLNSICEEPYQTAAIYCRADGSIDVYGITDSEGWLAFRTTQSEIDAVGIPSQNTLIERSTDGKIRLYRLSTGQFQVNSPIWDNIRGNLPDGYIFIFNGCS